MADVVDNSITAEANIVSIRFSWNSDNQWLTIMDDGHGISKDALRAAMRFGGTEPRETRSPYDRWVATHALKQASGTIGLARKDGMSCS